MGLGLGGSGIHYGAISIYMSVDADMKVFHQKPLSEEQIFV